MLKIAVIDNSIFDTNRIIQILKQIQSNTEIQSYNSITSFLTSKNNCDFLLLDIELDFKTDERARRNLKTCTSSI